MIKKSLLPLLALVAAATLLLIAPQLASAGAVVHPVCSDPGANIWDLGFNRDGTGPFELDAYCPDLVMNMWKRSEYGEHASSMMVVQSNLTKLTTTISGGPAAASGITVSMRICSFVLCGPKMTPDVSGLPVAEEQTLASGIPPVPVTLLIEETCTRVGGCDIQPDTVFSDLTLTFEDSTPPTVGIADAWDNSYSSSDLFKLGPLELGVLGDYVYVHASDSESFPTSMWWTFDDGPAHQADCGSTPDGEVPVDCGFFDGGSGMIQPPAFEGVTLLTVYVQDEAGNIGSASTTLTRDSIPPPAPTGLHIAGANAAGWITNYEFTAQWTNPKQPAGSDTESGVTHANFRILDEHGDVVREGSTDGEDIDSLQSFLSIPGKYTFEVSVLDAAGNESEAAEVDFRWDLIPPSAPTLGTIPIVNIDHAPWGVSFYWSEYTYWDKSFSGICGYSTAINSLPHYDPTDGPEVTVVMPGTPPRPTMIVISPEEIAALSDGVHYFHVAGKSCAGRYGRGADSKLVIDRKAPKTSTEPATGGWLAPGKPLVVRGDDSDPINSYAGVAKITYTVEGEAERTVTGPRADITLPQGMRTITFQAEDLAGNKSEENSIRAGVDDQAPSAAFGAASPADPALITANVTDLHSGVADAWIEYRSPGSPTWARLVGTSDGDSPRTLQARFPDDDSLPSGEYLLRIVSRDRAGNSNTTSSRVDGSPASLTLPLRRHPLITLTVAAGAKAKPSNSLTVPFGGAVTARGRLHDVDGTPLAGASIALSESISGGQRRQIAVVTTDGAGAFSSQIHSGPSRVISADFRGDAVLGAATASATFNVRARVTLKSLPKYVPAGKQFYLRGKVDPGMAPLPKAGVRIYIQHRSGSRWSGLFAEGKTASDGTFEIPWSQKTNGRARRLAFRAAAQTDGGWPYAEGYSAIRKVVIR